MSTSNIIVLAIGAAVGSLVTWRLLKEKYERHAQEEITEIRKFYADKANERSDNLEELKKSFEPKVFASNAETNDRAQANNICETNGYTKGGEKEVFNDDKPYVISPDEFGTIDYYETVSLTYYADGVLTDDADEPIDDVDDVVGTESLTHFGEYEDDSVFVRNDIYRCDYEILLDNRRYTDIQK